MQIAYPKEMCIRGADALIVGPPRDGQVRLIGVASTGEATGATLIIPSDPVFIARFCATLLKEHAGVATKRELEEVAS